MISITGKVFKINTTQKGGAFIKLMLKPNKALGQEKKWESAFISVYFSSKSLEYSKPAEGDIIEVDIILKNGTKENNYKDSYISMSCYNWSNRSKGNSDKQGINKNAWVSDYLGSNDNDNDNNDGMEWLNEL